jgi:hypothetical protein
MKDLPWELNSDLTKDRILAIANFIAEIRNEVIELHDEELGDTRLSLGMRAYERSRTRIIELAQKGEYSWLSILNSEGRFTFSIGDTPVRFTRNEVKYLPNRKLVVSENAMEQMTLLDVQPYSRLRWFVVFDTHYKSAADAVYFVGYSEIGEVICNWQIPLESSVTLIADVVKSAPEAVQLDKPLIGIRKTKELPDSEIDDK